MTFKTSLQRDLDRFYQALSNRDFNIREVTKGALTQARANLNPWAFRRLNEVAVNSFYNEASYYTWYGMKLLDVSSERNLLMFHLKKVNKGEMLLLDRGYPYFWALFLLMGKGIEFCVRLKDNWWLDVQDFTNSDEQERIVKFKLPKKDRQKLNEYPYMLDTEISGRLIKVVLENGDVEVLCTSSLDTEKYDINEFRELYHYRWNAEEAYKLLKSRFELEAFSGKTAKAVKQDFHAKVFLMTMCDAYEHPIEEKVIKEYKADKNRSPPKDQQD